MGRLHRTLKSTNRIAFGRVSKAKKMKTRLAAMLGKVRGAVSPGIEGPRAYSAFEPDLLIWVLATLINAAVSGFQFIYGKLPVARKEAFYRDMCRFGTFFGIDETLSPKGWAAFEAYYDEMVEGDLLGSHSMCRGLARSVIYPQDSAGTRFLGWGMDFLPIETLPPKIRDPARVAVHDVESLSHAAHSKCVAKIVPVFPRRLRFYPEYLRALDLGAM